MDMIVNWKGGVLMKKLLNVLLSFSLIVSTLAVYPGALTASADTTKDLGKNKPKGNVVVEVIEVEGELVEYTTTTSEYFTIVEVKEEKGTTVLHIDESRDQLSIESDFLKESEIAELEESFETIRSNELDNNELDRVELDKSQVDRVELSSWRGPWYTLPTQRGSTSVPTTVVSVALAMLAAAIKVPVIAIPSAGLAALLPNLPRIYWTNNERVRATLSGSEHEARITLFRDSGRKNSIAYKRTIFHRSI